LKNKNRKKALIIVVTVVMISLLILSATVLGYDTNVTQDFTLVITPQTIGLGVNNNFEWFNASDYSTKILSRNFVVSVPDGNATYLQPYFHDLRDDIVDDLEIVCTNQTVKMQLESNNGSVQDIIMTAVTDSMTASSNELVGRVNSNVDMKCNYEIYQKYVSDYISTSILPNVSEYETLKSKINNCKTELTTANNDLLTCQTTLDKTKKDYNLMTWCMIAIHVAFLVYIFFENATIGMQKARMFKWRKATTRGMDNSAGHTPPPSIVRQGSEYLKEGEQ
jgi:hypothetical protein